MATVAQYDITKLSPQQLFDLAVEHLMEQKIPSSNNTDCAYSTKSVEGAALSCAAGPFLPFYHEAMEGTSWKGLRLLDEQSPISIKGIVLPEEVDDIMHSLQLAHDMSTLVNKEKYLEEITSRLVKLAKKHNLTFQGELKNEYITKNGFVQG